MKQTVAIIVLAAVFLCIFYGCTSASGNEMECTLDNYIKAVEGDLPEDLHLTIYYLSPSYVTRRALSPESMINVTYTKKIVVESEELKEQLELLRKLDTSVLQPVIEKSEINTRLLYVFTTEKKILLQVDLTKINGTVFVNGFQVEDNPIFDELIEPFLTEDYFETMGFSA